MYVPPEPFFTEEIIKYFIDNFNNKKLFTYYERPNYNSDLITEYDIQLTLIELIIKIWDKFGKVYDYTQLLYLRYKLISDDYLYYFGNYGYTDKNVEELWKLKYTETTLFNIKYVEMLYNVINYYYNLHHFEDIGRDSYLIQLELSIKEMDYDKIFKSCSEYQWKKINKTL
jgi:hypothetical protein